MKHRPRIAVRLKRQYMFYNVNANEQAPIITVCQRIYLTLKPENRGRNVGTYYALDIRSVPC